MTGIVSESFVGMTAAAVLSISPTCPAWPPLTRAQDGVISKKTEREMTRTSLSLGQPSDIVWLCHRFTAVEKSPFRRRTHLPPTAANDDDQKPGQHLSQNIQQELRSGAWQRRPRTAEKTRFFLVPGRGRPLPRPPER